MVPGSRGHDLALRREGQSCDFSGVLRRKRVGFSPRSNVPNADTERVNIVGSYKPSAVWRKSDRFGFRQPIVHWGEEVVRFLKQSRRVERTQRPKRDAVGRVSRQEASTERK